MRYIDMPTQTQYPLRFVAGIFGVQQRGDSGALAPAFGWAVIHDETCEKPGRMSHGT